MDQTPEDPSFDLCDIVLDRSGIDNINFKAQAMGRKLHDDWDAHMVESLRKLGHDIGQVEHYERKVQEYLDRNGYSHNADDDADGM